MDGIKNRYIIKFHGIISIINCQLSIILLFALLFALPLKAQINIGSGDNPQPFSILELATKINKGGLRLPLLSTMDRDKLNLKDIVDPAIAKAAKGLVIYNTTTDCLEFWNGEKWLSLCSDVTADCKTIAFPYVGTSYELCPGSKISDLSALVEGNVQWYSSSDATTPLSSSTPLSSTTYYAEQNAYGCKCSRFPVSVTFGDCSKAIAGYGATTFADVMYDFQHQTLEAYYTGGTPSNYQWQVSITPNAGDFKNIDGAKFRFFTVPAHFADIYQDNNPGVDSLFFRCQLSNSYGSVVTSNTFNILFIRTEKADGTPIGNYGIDANGVRYLTIQKAGSANGIKIALLNLGQSQNVDGSYNNDAGDLGDFYQWGRVSDGHQRIVWSKDNTHVNQIAPYGGDTTTTSDTITRNLLGTPNYTTTTTAWGWDQIPNIGSDAGYYGKFIKTSSGEWGDGSANSSARWGNGSNLAARPASEITWSYPENNPCPSGWRIPSRWNIMDIYNGDSSTLPPPPISNASYSGSTINAWYWRYANNNATGGAIIKNVAAPNEKVFLIEAGMRNLSTGALGTANTAYYWSSTTYSNASNAYYLGFDSNVINMNTSYYDRARGMFVRCIAE